MREINNKRGFFLMETTLKIIIAVISIAFLVGFLASLYIRNQNANQLEFAEASLDLILETIASGNTEVEIYSPSGWNIVVWENTKPDQCSSQGWAKCICICKVTLTNRILFASLVTANDCGNNGICVETKYNLPRTGIKIDPPTTLIFDHTKKEINYR